MRNSAASGETLTGSVSVSLATGAAADALPVPLRGGDGGALPLPRQLLAFTADRELGRLIVHTLADANLRIDLATTADKAHALLHNGSYHVAIIDLQLPAQAGLELVTLLRAISPGCACLVLSSSRNVATAVTALKEGAADFLLKPVQPEILQHKAGALLLASPPVVASRWHVERSARGFAGILGTTPLMQQLFGELAQLAGQPEPVLITGEPGTGKDLFARAIHELSQRRGPLLRVRVGAVPATELMLQLLGQERVGTDGIPVIEQGLIEQAHGGTLLLDEIAELDAGGQRCLRQLLSGNLYARRGASQLRRSQVRLIAMSSQPLLELVRRGQFCTELFHRLSLSWLALPPLRQRREDIPLLAAAILSRTEHHHTHGPIELPASTLLRLKGHSWPGNVSELQAVLRQAVRQQPTRVLEPECIARLLSRTGPTAEGRFPAGTPMATVEREMILLTLAAVDGNKQRAAELLGLSRGALYSRLRQYTAQARSQWQQEQQHLL